MADERKEENIPNHQVIAVINGSASADEAARDLEQRGFHSEVMSGEEAVAHLQKGDSSGLLNKIVKAAQDHLSEETNYRAQYEEEARNGNDIISVRVKDQEQAEEVKNLLETHGARNMRYFGALSVADLTPESNPSLRSSESAERQSNV